MTMYQTVSQIRLDVHRVFSIACFRDGAGEVVAQERLEYTDRDRLRHCSSRWPAGTPVILERTFGWGWISDELTALNMDRHLASSRKVPAVAE